MSSEEQKEKLKQIIKVINEKADTIEILNNDCDLDIDQSEVPKNIYCVMPFHSDINEPSMRVYDNNSGCYCYGCGRNYDNFNLLMNVKGLKVGETIRYFKDIYNIEIPEDEELTEGSFKLNNQISYYIRLLRAKVDKEGSMSINSLKGLERALKSSYRMEKLSSSFKKFIKLHLDINIKS